MHIGDGEPFLQRQEPARDRSLCRGDASAGRLAPPVALTSFHPDSLTRRRVRPPLADQLPEPGLPLPLLLLPCRHVAHLHEQGCCNDRLRAATPSGTRGRSSARSNGSSTTSLSMRMPPSGISPTT